MSLLRRLWWPLCVLHEHVLCVFDGPRHLWSCRCGAREETGAAMLARVSRS